MEKLIQSIEDEFELLKKRTINQIKSFFGDVHQASSRTSMKLKLKFINKISQTILTGEKIKGEGGTLIEIALVDDATGTIIDVGPEASASVQIVLLKGEATDSEQDDLTVEQFNGNIVPEMEGKQPLLAGNISLKLRRGIGVAESIWLRHHAIKIRPPVFKLGARAVDVFDGVRIKEANTKSFTVKDFRNKYYKKHEIPSLSDEVSRLVNIRKGGKIDRRLQDKEIKTVEDFLIRLLINPNELKSIVNLGPKKWKATVSNAQACLTGERMYSYLNLEQKKCVIFNVLGHVLGMYFESHYYPSSMLSEEHKANAGELLASAYENWENVHHFDAANSLHQHLSYLTTNMDTAGSVKLDCPEVVGETSSRRSNISLHSVSSTMNSFRELTSWEDFSSFGTDDVDAERIVCDVVTHSPPFNYESLFPDDCFMQNDGCEMQQNGLVNESYGEDTLVESEVVRTRRWKKLLCVSRLFLIRKRVSVDVTAARKKQKRVQQ